MDYEGAYAFKRIIEQAGRRIRTWLINADGIKRIAAHIGASRQLVGRDATGLERAIDC